MAEEGASWVVPAQVKMEGGVPAGVKLQEGDCQNETDGGESVFLPVE